MIKACFVFGVRTEGQRQSCPTNIRDAAICLKVSWELCALGEVSARSSSFQ